MSDFNFGNYYQVDSLIHRLDPRVKLNLVLLLMTAAFITDTLVALLPIALFVLTMWIIARIPFRIVWRSLLPLLVFMLVPVCMNVFFNRDGVVLFELGSVSVTDEGISQGLYAGFRLVLLASSGVLLTLTTTSLAIAYAITEMLEPFKRFDMPAYEIGLMIRIALRFIPDVASSFNHIRKAQAARGAVFDSGGPIKRLGALVPCMVPLFAQCYRNAENLGVAMESRCYTVSNRSHYRSYKATKSDYVAIACCLVLLATSIAWRILG